MSRRLIALLVAVGCSACAGAADKAERAFSTDWQNDGGESFAQVQKRLAGARLPDGASIAVGVTRTGLVGVSLDGSAKWRDTTPVDARPAVTGSVVVATGGRKLFALDATSGKRLWAVSSQGGSLRGAGDDGKVTIASLGTRSGGGSLLLVVDRAGKTLLELEPQADLGTPAVLNGIAFVPWDDRYVSAIEISRGAEVGRLVLREDVSHAVNLGGELYFGQASLVRFDESIARAAAGGAHKLVLPARELPGSPQWLGPAGVRPAVATLRSRVELYALPELRGQRLVVAQQRFAATYFRLVMGFDAESAVLRWVRTSPREFIGGAAAQGGFVLCDVSGNVRLFDHRGGDAGETKLGSAVDACVVQAAGFRVPQGKPPAPLADQIAEALEVREAEMTVAQRMLLRELATVPDPKITKLLIDLASSPHTSPMLLQDARSFLSSRRTGKEYMLSALANHYDFLSNVLRPPPVGPLADALAALDAKEAAPHLASHLNDPANTPDDVERAARALAVLATPKELEELRTFFSLYRATADQQELVNAVISVARALLQVGGEDEKRLVERAAEDPLTHPEVRRGLSGLMQGERPAAVGSASAN